MSRPLRDDATDGATDELEGLRRFGGRSALGWLAVLLGVVPFLVLWLLIRDASSAVATFDRSVAADLNEAVHGSPLLIDALKVVTDLADTWTAVIVFVLTTVFVAIQRRWRLAAFVAATGIGLAILSPVAKALIGRARPIVEVPVVETPVNASFPSGHAMTAVAVWGTVTLIALPAVRRAARPWLLAALVVLVGLIGFTRLALGVHYLSDVVAGWALGGAWLTATVLAFRPWPDTDGTEHELDPMQQHDADVIEVGHPRQDARVDGARLARLAASAAALATALMALGLLVTAAWGDTWLGRWDRRVVAAVAEWRTATLTDLMTVISALSATSTVVAGGLAISMLALAATRSWRPALFVAVTLTGEALLYLAVSRVVDRLRPDVADLTNGIPTAASWPSGHVTAAVALYGALAALLIRYTSARARWSAAALPVVVALAVAASRVYVAAHYPTDVLAGLVLGTAWLIACSHWLLPHAIATRPLRDARPLSGNPATAGPRGARGSQKMPVAEGTARRSPSSRGA